LSVSGAPERAARHIGCRPSHPPENDLNGSLTPGNMAESFVAPVGKVFDWREAQQAFARIQQGEQFGKVVIRWS